MMLRPSSINQIALKYPYAFRVLATDPIGYWKLDETSGSVAYDSSGNGFNGTYIGATLSGGTFSNGDPCPSFDGNDFVNLYSAGLAAAFNPALGSMMIWRQSTNLVNAQKYYMKFAVNASNWTLLDNAGVANRARGFYRATASQQQAINYTQANWTQLFLTWNKALDRVKFYLAGVNNLTINGLGVWAGSLAATLCGIGADNTAGASGDIGLLSNGALWNKELTQAEITSILTPA